MSNKWLSLILIVAIVGSFGLLCCKSNPTSSSSSTPSGTLLNYTDCKSFQKLDGMYGASPDQDCIEYQYDGKGTLILKHINAGFNCCPDYIMAVITIQDNIITIEEKESLESGGCECLCLYDLNLEIINLRHGDYLLQVIEPYVKPDEELLKFNIKLSVSSSSGTYCVKRQNYPWGIELAL